MPCSIEYDKLEGQHVKNVIVDETKSIFILSKIMNLVRVDTLVVNGMDENLINLNNKSIRNTIMYFNGNEEIDNE